MLLKASLDNLEWKIFFSETWWATFKSVLLLTSLGKLTNHFWKVKSNPVTCKRVVNMCLILNMPEFWIFANFRKYNRIQNIHGDAIKEEFWVFQDFKYGSLLHMQALYEVLNMPEYGWIMLHDRVLNMPGQCFNAF